MGHGAFPANRPASLIRSICTTLSQKDEGDDPTSDEVLYKDTWEQINATVKKDFLTPKLLAPNGKAFILHSVFKYVF